MTESTESIEQYKSQLEMIESALSADPDNGDLLQLKSDLQTLIQMMDDPEPCPGPSSSSSSSLSQDLDKLPGLKVRALVSDTEDSREFGNAVISSVEGNRWKIAPWEWAGG